MNLDGLSGEWVYQAQADPRRALLYFHGGAYVVGSPATHRALCARLSRQADARVLVLDYRLAPEHPYPAAVDDAVKACLRLFRDFDPGCVLLAGDSAGGGLAIATLMALRDAGHPLPRRVCCLSPWVDLEIRGESITGRASSDPLLTPDWLRDSARLYAGGTKTCEPRISPLRGELEALPPLLIQVGSDEILLSDARRLAQRARSAGVEVTLDVWEGRHVAQLADVCRLYARIRAGTVAGRAISPRVSTRSRPPLTTGFAQRAGHACGLFSQYGVFPATEA